MKAGDRAGRSVLRLVTRLNVGGPARQALLLTRDLADEFPTVLAAGRPPEAEGELSDPEVPVRHVPLTRRVAPATDARALWSVRRLIAATRPAIVHTHMAKAGTVGRLAARGVRPRPRTIHTFHGHVLDGYFRPAVERAFVTIERYLARSTDVLVAVSAQIRDQLLDLGVGREDQFRVVPLGLELGPFLAVGRSPRKLQRELGLVPGTRLVGAVGRLVPIKDLATLLDAVAPLPDVHVVLVGDGEARPDLQRRARELGLAGRAHFVGWRADVPTVLADLDVVALSSRNEGTPVALIEALAAARPVVATAVGGVPDVVHDGRTGRLVPPGDSVALGHALAAALSDRRGAEHMARAGRCDVQERFGSERLLADIGTLYRNVLDDP